MSSSSSVSSFPPLLSLCLFCVFLFCFCFTCAPLSVVGQWSKLNSNDPCFGLPIREWREVPDTSITTEPDFDAAEVTPDFLTINYANDYQVKFPNGFRKAQIYEDNDPPFCLTVNNVMNRQVQLQIQTVNSNDRLCFRDSSSNSIRANAVQERCFTDRTLACFSALTYSNSLNLVFYTDSAGASSATPFWYRVIVSPTTWDLSSNSDARANSALSTLEMWCMTQQQKTDLMKYPIDLRSDVVPPNVKINVQTDTSAAQSITTTSTITITIIAIITTCILTKRFL